MTYFKTARHSGGLKECLETELPVSNDVADILISSGIYIFYAFDDRIGASRYILKDLHINFGLPTWLHKYEVK